MTKFQDLPIGPEVLRALTELGFASPTPIQAETLPFLLANDTDYLGLAATGTGKTAAFGIPLLERIDRSQKGVQALILCPTRELAMQVAGQLDLLGKYLEIRALPIYGGTGYGDQIYGLKNGATIVVGTPGRVVDHLEKGMLRLDGLKTLVLDEADEMISMGFKDDLETILQGAPSGQANIWLFSATMGPEVQHVANAYLREPQRVQINKTEMLSSSVEQIYYKTHEYDKPELLCRLIDAADDFYGIVFCQTKALVADVTELLKSKGYRADCLHGDLDQAARDRVMKSFRDRNISILVATDVACRGLDVKDITHVVNYSIPRELDNYVHRIGRTARSGKAGLALSLVTYSHRELIGRIERMTRSKMKEGVAPTPKDIALIRLNRVRAAFEKSPQGRATAMIPAEWKAALATMSPDDIAGRFLALLLPDLFADRQEETKLQDSRPQPAAEARPERRMDARPEQRSDARPYGKPKFGKKPFGAKKFSDERPRDGGFRKPREGGFDDRPRERGFSHEPRERGFSSAPRERGFSGPRPNEYGSKPRWNKKVTSQPRPATPDTDSGWESGKMKKKKPYGHWKSKKARPARPSAE